MKSQIHAGGRGKGNLHCPDTGDLLMEGGVKIAFSEEEVRTYAENILGHLLVTKQTGPEGKMVNHLYIEAGCDIAHEYYLAMLVDRERKSVLIMASTEGGMDIEEVAETNPDAIHKVWVDPHSGLLPFQCRNLGSSLGLEGVALKSFTRTLASLYDVFRAEDCAMVEINPLVRTTEDLVLALDAKVSFDANATFRHASSWEALRDDPRRRRPRFVRPKQACPTSSSTVTSDASSMEQGWPWRRWMSSNSMVVHQRISSMSEEVRMRNR